MMKKIRHLYSRSLTDIFIILIISMLLASCGKAKELSIREIKIAVLIYDEYDTFVNSVTKNMVKWCRQREKEDGIRITVDVVDARKNQLTQDDQARKFITENYDVLCVNLVDRTDASGIIDKAMASDTPVIFFNREPVAEDLGRWDKLYYVGAIARQSGELQAKIITDALSDPEKFSKIDVNGNGTIQYVMLEGEAGHQDTVVRTNVCTSAIVDEGYYLEKLGDEYANWDRDQAKAKMLELAERYPFQIEMVIANNDDMALGALDALNECDYALDPFVVGINGTEDALEAIRTMKLDGSVYNDAKGQGETIMEMAYDLGMGKAFPDTLELVFNKYVFTPYSIITYDNVQQYLNADN